MCENKLTLSAENLFNNASDTENANVLIDNFCTYF